MSNEIFKGSERAKGKNPSQEIPIGKWGMDYSKDLENLDSISWDRIVEIADATGRRLANKKYGGIDLKINQIRKFLDEARKIESSMKKGNFEKYRVILLRPKLAYLAGREKKVKDLMNILDPAIKSASESQDNFHKLLKLIESIVAYHRYYEGTN